MSKNEASFLGSPVFVKLITYFVVFWIIVLWILSFLTHDSSLLLYIKVAIYVLVFSEATIFFRAYLTKLKMEEIEKKRKEEMKALADAEFNREKAQGGKIATTELFGRQQEKEVKAKTRQSR